VLKIPRGSHSEIAWRLGQLRTAVEGSRCNRSNLHQAEAALESELARVRQIRAMLEPAAEVAS